MVMTFKFHFEAKKSQSGFALFLVLVLMVIASIASLSGSILQTPMKETRAMKATNDKRDVLLTAIARFKSDNGGSAPATLDELVTTTGTPCAADNNPLSATYRQLQGWCGPYVDRIFTGAPDEYKTDGWGVTFSYDGATLTSCGQDKTCGNGDDLADAI